jgi:hypothetical protein
MNRLVTAAFLALGTCASLPAQQTGLFSVNSSNSSSHLTSTSDSYLFPELAPPAAPAAFPAPKPALPNAPAPPQTGALNEPTYRWELAAGFEYVHFQSGPFDANLFGFHTAAAYNINDYFALEGSLVSAFGGDVLGGEQARFVMYTGGGRFGWKLERRRWAPWVHALVGGVRVNPQTANESKNGFALQAGGGADFRFNPRMSFRGEVDYIHTMLYSSSQNNFQVGAGVVFHF